MDYTVCGIHARILEWGNLSLLQGIFPTQGWNLALSHCRQILYQLSHWSQSQAYIYPLPLNKVVYSTTFSSLT